MGIVIPIIIFFIILSVVISIHELGHYLAARRAGIFVEEFALGMGPKIFGIKGKKKSHDGETTLYSLRVFPIGGFCKMRGMEDDPKEDPEALNVKPIKSRISVMAGGAVMNFLLAYFIFFVMIMIQGNPTDEIEVIITDVSENMPAYNAGLMEEDIITHVNGILIQTQSDVSEIINASGGQTIYMRVNRGGTERDFLFDPAYDPVEDRYRIGITHNAQYKYERARLIDGIYGSGEMLVTVITEPFRMLIKFISGEPMPEGGMIGGPILIGDVIVEAYNVTIERSFSDMLMTMIFFTGLLNAAVGIMNLLPIPAMDGARIVFLIIEAIRKKPVPPEKEAVVHLIGFAVLITLAIFIAYKDIARIIARVIGNDLPG